MSLFDTAAVARGTSYLTEADEVLAEIIEDVGTIRIEPRADSDFKALCRIIVSQQLSGKAADTIFSRLEKLCDQYGPFLPETVIQIDQREIRNCGISNLKSSFLHEISEVLRSNPDTLEAVERLSNEECIDFLTKHRGVGTWTASIFLLSQHGRIDVFPHGDGTLIRTIKKIYKNQAHNTESVKRLSERWSPYKGLAARYIWHWTDLVK